MGTSDRNQEIRAQLLIELYGARPLALTSALIHRRLRRAQYDFAQDEIVRELAFLAGQQLVGKSIDPVTAEARYTITSAGVLQYENP